MRAFVWDPIRAGHYGQRPRVPRKKAEHTGAPTNAAAYVKKALANSEPSTHGGKADIGMPNPDHFQPAGLTRYDAAMRRREFIKWDADLPVSCGGCTRSPYHTSRIFGPEPAATIRCSCRFR